MVNWWTGDRIAVEVMYGHVKYPQHLRDSREEGIIRVNGYYWELSMHWRSKMRESNQFKAKSDS